jgi:hypothetical protein
MMTLDPMLLARSVAVVGASERQGSVGDQMLRQLVSGGFAGPVYPVNPRYETLHGLRCYPDLESVGGPVDLVVLAVASDDAVFGQPEIRFGAAVVAHVMPWLIGARRAKEYLLTGEDRIPAVEAERIGLINRVVPREDLEGETMKLANALAVVDPLAMQTTKRAINQSWEAAGFRQALLAGVELGAIIETGRVPEREEFERIAAAQGLGEAIRWRDERFEK